MEHYTKLLNPKWVEALAVQDSGGAYEISQQMSKKGLITFTKDSCPVYY
jgi:cobalamin biosynthesis Mg chelatase CobN